MQSPRIELVFGLWQCDKENHGWREGPAADRVLDRVPICGGPSPYRYIQLEKKGSPPKSAVEVEGF
jgi:hypothetical protein